jgi:hypothetical protein
MDRKAEEEPIAELWATTTTPRGPTRLPITPSWRPHSRLNDR